MANATASSQSASHGRGRSTGQRTLDIDRSLDAGPGRTSGHDRPDPVSGGAEDHRDAEQDLAESLLDQIRDALGDLAEGIPEAGRDTDDQSSANARARPERSPDTTRRGEVPLKPLSQRIMENPWAWLLAAGGLGYSLAWMIYTSRVGCSPMDARRETQSTNRP